MVQIIPTILIKNFQEFQYTVKKIEKDFPVAHIDVMDGKFVPNITFFNIDEIEKIDTPLRYEVHLMVENPMHYLEKMKNSQKIKKILFHYESGHDIKIISSAIRSLGRKSALAVNPDTSIEDIKNHLVNVDGVMLMGVFPGASGQAFISETIERVRALRDFDPNIDIEIDGGVSDKTAKALVEAGATILAVGSFMYKDKPVAQKKKILKSVM